MIVGDIYINRCPAAVFDFVADERNECTYNPKIGTVALLTDEPIGIGSRFHAVLAAGRRRTEMEIEYTAFERPAFLASVTRLRAMEIHGSLTFTPEGDGTRMRWSWNLRPRGALRAASPIIEWTGRRQERFIWESLKRVLEASETSTTSPGRPS